MSNITERIKTLEDAKKEIGRPDIDFSIFPEDLRKYMEALYNATVIIESLNEGWKPDWSDLNEYKWIQWFKMSPWAFAFLDSYCGFETAAAGSGSRLRFKSKELSDYAAKQFPEIFKDLQIG